MKHGTYTGASQHWKNHEPCCTPCLLAARQYQQQRRWWQRQNGHAACGTNAGYMRHQKQHKTVCPECREAHNQYMRQLRANGPVNPKRPPGFNPHLCQACDQPLKNHPIPGHLYAYP